MYSNVVTAIDKILRSYYVSTLAEKVTMLKKNMDTTVHTETTEYKGIQQVIDNVHC